MASVVGIVKPIFMSGAKETDLVLLAKSLGFYVSTHRVSSAAARSNPDQDPVKLGVKILGDIQDIPTRIARKQAVQHQGRRDRKMLTILRHRNVGPRPFVSICLDGDNLFLREDCLVLSGSETVSDDEEDNEEDDTSEEEDTGEEEEGSEEEDGSEEEEYIAYLSMLRHSRSDVELLS